MAIRCSSTLFELLLFARIVQDPLTKLKAKMAKKGKINSEIKTISEAEVVKALRNIKKKKSCGSDGLSQEHLAMGVKKLSGPLTQIFNESIKQGIFPENWKSALITPVIKKGDKSVYANYRPVSCLPAAAKLLEKIVCSQVEDFMESNGLIPDTQHGSVISEHPHITC